LIKDQLLEFDETIVATTRKSATIGSHSREIGPKEATVKFPKCKT